MPAAAANNIVIKYIYAGVNCETLLVFPYVLFGAKKSNAHAFALSKPVLLVGIIYNNKYYFYIIGLTKAY